MIGDAVDGAVIGLFLALYVFGILLMVAAGVFAIWAIGSGVVTVADWIFG